MGKKTVKTGSVLGYLWILLGIAVLGVSVLLHVAPTAVEALANSLSFMVGDDKAMLRYIGMGVGGVLLLLGYMNKPRKKESK